MSRRKIKSTVPQVVEPMPDDLPDFPSDGPYVTMPLRSEPVVPAPPKPERVPMAKVESRWQRAWAYYTITGSLEGVREEVAHLSADTLYFSSFKAPIEIEPGVWQSTGCIHHSTD